MKKYEIVIIYFLFLILIISIKNRIQKLKDNEYNFKKIEIYYNLCNKGILLNKKYFKRNNNPKISIISPVYNKEKYLLRYLRSIQNQFFDDIEIILVDDNQKIILKKKLIN
jgi:cellulose synthase/poly-beta-1,6-N-acetylglucosamine synthase-like glycosyltransferase